MHVVQQPYGDEVPNTTLRHILSAAGLAALLPFLAVLIASQRGVTPEQMDRLVIVPIALFVLSFPILIATITPKRGVDDMARSSPHHGRPLSAPKWPYVMIGALALLAVTLAVIIYGGFAFIVNE
jgi:hypothetical protein